MTDLALVVSGRVLCSLGGFRARRTKVTPIVIGFCLWAVLFTGPAGFSYVSGVCWCPFKSLRVFSESKKCI